jgi:ferredoxin
MTANRVPGDRVVLGRDDLDRLFLALREDGFTVVGPTVRDGAIVYDEIVGIVDLPDGFTDVQEPGKYRLERREDRALFGYAVGPHSWKKFFHVPSLTLFRARRSGDSFAIEKPEREVRKLALVGVRACEIQAIAVQDRVLAQGAEKDPHYVDRRRDAFVIALNCGQAGGTCFCVSMKTGPRATSGFDLALTELLSEKRHDFLVEVGSERGRALLGRVPHRPAEEVDLRTAERVVERTARSMGRSLETEGIKELLYENLEHPRWDDVAQRCLACTNCTMVCPTCFCTTVEDVNDLKRETAERRRVWDSCFTLDFSHVHGGSVRSTIKSRYRQWLTHKLGTWIDQFGTSGCVGCGRCITWCPVGIDITEEVRAIRASPRKAAP